MDCLRSTLPPISGRLSPTFFPDMPPIRNYVHRFPVGTLLQHTPHPRGCPGNWYAYEFRQTVMSVRDNGEQLEQVILRLQGDQLWPDNRTIQRWRNRRQLEGYFRPYRRTGNTCVRVLRGLESFQLAWLMSVYLRINAAKINMFLYNANSQILFYDPSQIYIAQQQIGLSKKFCLQPQCRQRFPSMCRGAGVF